MNHLHSIESQQLLLLLPPPPPPSLARFSMCRSKRSTDVVRPDTPKSSKSFFSFRTASSLDAKYPQPPSSSNFFTVTSSSYSYSSSLPSTPTLLSALKPLLPENPHIYPFSEISSATGNFLRNHLSPSSWHSTLHGKRVAIFRRKLRRPIDNFQLTEKLSLICRSHHRSIVKLLGATVQGHYIYLIYDLVQGLNLSDCLRNKLNPNYTVLSTWMSRLRIASDIAHGLEYMHYCAGINGSGFVHNHVKSSSIIIMEERKSTKLPSYVAKIGHFATAELCGEVFKEESCSRPKSSDFPDTKLKRSNNAEMKFEGTRGYMSPEFRTTGIGTRKSDVYTFGVVILELLCGEEPLKYTRLKLRKRWLRCDWSAWRMIQTGGPRWVESPEGSPSCIWNPRVGKRSSPRRRDFPHPWLLGDKH